MKKLECTIWALWVVLAATTPEVLAQSRKRIPPPQSDRGGEKLQVQQHPLDRWAAMPPQQREAALAKLPPARQEAIRKRLANWERMTPEQKQRARDFLNKPADQQRIIRDHAKWMQTLPQERRQVIRKEINSLQSLSPEARQAELESPSFGRRFNQDERDRIGKMVSTMQE